MKNAIRQINQGLLCRSGGVFDDEFAHASEMFFKQVREGRFTLVVSEVVQNEISGRCNARGFSQHLQMFHFGKEVIGYEEEI